MGLSQLLTQPGGHEVKKRKATRVKQVERKLKKGGPGLLIQSQHEKKKDLETRKGVKEKEIKKKITIEPRAHKYTWYRVPPGNKAWWLVSLVLGIFIESSGFSLKCVCLCVK